MIHKGFYDGTDHGHSCITIGQTRIQEVEDNVRDMQQGEDEADEDCRK